MAGTTVWLPLDIRAPRFNTNPGNVYWTVSSFGSTIFDNGYWVFDKTGATDVTAYAFAYVPKNMNATPAAAIVLSWTSDQTTGNFSSSVSTKMIRDGDTTNNFNPANFTSFIEATQTITVAATAWTRKDVVYPASGNLLNTPVAGDILLVEIRRVGASDTLSATKLFLMAGFLRIDI